MHPEYNFLSHEKYRDQVSRVHKSNVVIETDIVKHLHLSINHCIVTNDGNNYENIVRNENTLSQEAITENIPNDNLSDKEFQFVEKFKPLFNNNFETIEDRVYASKFYKNVPTN